MGEVFVDLSQQTQFAVMLRELGEDEALKLQELCLAVQADKAVGHEVLAHEGQPSRPFLRSL